MASCAHNHPSLYRGGHLKPPPISFINYAVFVDHTFLSIVISVSVFGAHSARCASTSMRSSYPKPLYRTAKELACTLVNLQARDYALPSIKVSFIWEWPRTPLSNLWRFYGSAAKPFSIQYLGNQNLYIYYSCICLHLNFLKNICFQIGICIPKS